MIRITNFHSGAGRKKVSDILHKLWTDEGGLTTVEYALLLMLVVIAGATAWASLGHSVDRCAQSGVSVMPN